MSDKLISWLRTVVPGLWSALVAYLLAQGIIPTDWSTQAEVLGQAVLIPVALSVVYPLLRAVESKLPAWLTVLLLGANKQPTYIDQAA